MEEAPYLWGYLCELDMEEASIDMESPHIGDRYGGSTHKLFSSLLACVVRARTMTRSNVCVP